TASQVRKLEKGGFVYWDWTIDSMDWKYRNSKSVTAVLQQLENMEHSHSSRPYVILMHDLPASVNALPALFHKLKEKGYSFGVL
ncbi:polysaccharide deacetylase, partial [Bacillus vallismortis]|nr:polysaccharide deacetylase [Bacillus vallismortis]